MLKYFLTAACCLNFAMVSAEDTQKEESKNGRYQITSCKHDSNPYVFLVDTQTGQVWESYRSWGSYKDWQPLPPLPVQE